MFVVFGVFNYIFDEVILGFFVKVVDFDFIRFLVNYLMYFDKNDVVYN